MTLLASVSCLDKASAIGHSYGGACGSITKGSGAGDQPRMTPGAGLGRLTNVIVATSLEERSVDGVYVIVGQAGLSQVGTGFGFGTGFGCHLVGLQAGRW
jgi:hypothetical protein